MNHNVALFDLYLAFNASYPIGIKEILIGIIFATYSMSMAKTAVDTFTIDNNNLGEFTMKWSKPQYTDLRIGFEVTMYFANR